MNSIFRNYRWIVVAAAFVGMGVSMPSCPGQQAMQQQIDSLQTTNNDLNKRVHALDASVKTLNGNITDITKVLQQTSANLDAQSKMIQSLSNELNQMKTVKAAPARKAKSLPAKRRR